MLDVGYWWPTMYKDMHDYYISYDACQRTWGLTTQCFTNIVTSFSRGTIYEMGTWFCGAN
jgi:hypothetical protein